MEEFQLWWLEYYLYFIAELKFRLLALKESPLKCTESNVIGKNNWEIHYNFYRGDWTILLLHIYGDGF